MTVTGNVEQKLQHFTAGEWNAFTAKEKSDVLMCYRLAYRDFAWVNWCEALGTVLANDEVKDGVSERGGHPVERRQLAQWFLRITPYAERLLSDLDALDWSESMKEMQRHWIGKSEGARVQFTLKNGVVIEVFTTRPDTIFGVSFVVVAPESEIVPSLTTAEQKSVVETYVQQAKNRSERERQMDVKTVSGVFTGSFAAHPFTGEPIPVWIADYVLAGYGTGAVMGVPAHDERDFRFASHFNLPILPVVKPAEGDLPDVLNDAFSAKEGICINSDFLNGLTVQQAIKRAIEELEKREIGTHEITYRLRDANFSRQRYWGEPFPILHRPDGSVETVPENELPLELPPMDDFKPTGRPESPLAKLTEWVNLPDGTKRETDTMPGFAGSSWYFLRYMDPKNDKAFASKDALNYWQDVDLYIGGTEHAVGHLLYSRFWHKFLYDLGYVPTVEPFKKLVNQGMIQGRSNFVHRVKGENKYVSYGLKEQYATIPLHVDVNFVQNDELDLEAVKAGKLINLSDAEHAEWVTENGKFICGWEVEKMSKSKWNVVNPDDIIAKYGADTLRMYEMFLGPVEQSKPWNTNGIEGVNRFLKKLWKLFHPNGAFSMSEEAATKKELKVLHTAIKKVSVDMGHFGFNTCVSHYMICCNELTDAGCHKRAVLEPLLILLSPFAPHITEELWQKAGHTNSISTQSWPLWNEDFLQEDNFNYPVSFNGKMRFQIELPISMDAKSVEEAVLADERCAKWLEGKQPKKIIVVPKKIMNMVI
jgi:leucyl-tRNA synthetase